MKYLLYEILLIAAIFCITSATPSVQRVGLRIRRQSRPGRQRSRTNSATASPTSKPYVARKGDFLTLGEASYIIGVRDSDLAISPTVAPEPKDEKIVFTPNAVAALQRLPDDRLAKLIKNHTKGKVILTPEKVKLFKELEPEVLADLINSGDDIDAILDEDDTVEEPVAFVPSPRNAAGGGPVDWYNYNNRAVFPAYPVYPAQNYNPNGQQQPYPGHSNVGTNPYPQQGRQTNNGGTTGSGGHISDAKLRLLQKLKPESIVKLVKKEAGIDITLEEAELVKTSSLEELREIINSNRVSGSESTGSATGPYVYPGSPGAFGQQPNQGPFGTFPQSQIQPQPQPQWPQTQIQPQIQPQPQPQTQPQARAPLHVSDGKLRLLQKLKPATIVSTVRNRAGYEISLEEAEWIKTASLEEIREAMDEGTLGTPIPTSNSATFPQSASSQAQPGGFNFQPRSSSGFSNSGLFGPGFGKRRRKRKTARQLRLEKEERQAKFADFYHRLPSSQLGVSAQRGCQPYPGLSRIFFVEGPRSIAARRKIKNQRIIHRFREGTLKSNYGDKFATVALAPHRVIPECSTDANAGCPEDLVNTAQIKKLIHRSKPKPLLLMNCEQQELAMRLIKNGYVFKNSLNKPFFNQGRR